MKITYRNFVLVKDESRYDLHLLKEGNRLDENKNPTGETFIAEKVIGYSFKLSEAIKRMMYIMVEEGKENETVDLKQHISDLQEIHALIIEELDI